MDPKRATLDDVRQLYAAMIVAASGSDDPRLSRLFEAVPREAFLPPGPWTLVMAGGRTVQTPTADPVHLYQNVLVALDRSQGINTGEPHLHAAWLGASAPKADETITHIGAGTGYYTAILSMLALPAGRVIAYEVHDRLAEDARRNLAPFENVDVRHENAVEATLPPSDLIYVNAGVVVPPVGWLTALRPNGRLIFPWRPSERIGLAALVTATADGFDFKPLMPAFFIPCVGAAAASSTSVTPDYSGVWRTRSVRLRGAKAPDGSATAIYDDIWFSDRPVSDAG